MATLSEIAKLAGVSVSTVSNYINKTKHVSETCGQKIESVLQVINYSPDSHAEMIRAKRTRLIVMAVPTVRTTFFSELLDEFEKICHELEFTIVRINLEGSSSYEKKVLEMSLARNTAGMIVLGFHLQPQLKDFALHKRVPTVILDWDDIRDRGFVENPSLGSRIAIEALLAYGHRDIALVTGDLTAERSQLQLNSATQTLESAGVVLKQSWIYEGDYSPPSGLAAAKSLLSGPHRPSAVFCFSDSMAMGFLSGAYSMGIRIPDDVSVIGYDDIEMSAYTSPPLTTIQVSARLIANNIFESLNQKIIGTETTSIPKIEPTIHWRSSISKKT